MAIVFDEFFEGNEYDHTWSEGVGSGCTIDGNADPTDVSDPTGWGTYCLKYIHNVIDVSVSNYSFTQFGDGDTRYNYFELIITDFADITSNGDYFYIMGGTNNALSTACWYCSIEMTGGVRRFKLTALLNGAASTVYWSDNAVAEDTLYIIEVEWDSSGSNNFEWRIDGVMQDQGNLISGHANQGTCFAGNVSNNSDGTFYIDRLQVDGADWIYTAPSSSSSESSSSSSSESSSSSSSESSSSSSSESSSSSSESSSESSSSSSESSSSSSS